MAVKEAVVFLENNARIIKDQSEIERVKGWSNVLLDPDRSKVERLHPHFWKMGNDEVLPMSAMEQKIRLGSIEQNGIDNSIVKLSTKKVAKQFPFVAVFCILALIVAVVVVKYAHH